MTRNVVARAMLAAFAVSLLVLVAILAAVDWPARSYWNGDHVVFWGGSRAVLTGVSPYEAAWWEALPHREGRPEIVLPYRTPSGAVLTTAYPLWTFVVLAPFGALPYDLAAGVWLIAQIAGVSAGLVALSFVLLRDPRRDLPLILGFALGFQPTWILAGNGNVTGFLFGALAGALSALISGRPYVAGLLLGLLAIKPHSFALVPLVVLVGAQRPLRVVAGALTTGVILVALAFAVRPGWVGEWLPHVAAARTAGLSNATAATLDRVFGLSSAPIIGVALAVMAFVIWWRMARPGLAALFGAAVAISLFIAPYGWSYDQLHVLIVAVVIVSCLPAAGPLRTAGLVLLAVVAGLVPWLLYAAAFGRGGEELSAVTPLLFFALLVAAQRLRGVPHPDPAHVPALARTGPAE